MSSHDWNCAAQDLQPCDCGLDGLLAENERLRAAFSFVSERQLDDGSLCFCSDPPNGKPSAWSSTGSEHAGYCEAARAALAGAPE